MLSLAEAKLALEVGGAAIATFDKIYPWLVRIATGREPNKAHSVTIERRGDTLVSTKDGQVRHTIRYEQLMKRLSPDDIGHVRMFEKSIDNYKAQIEVLWPQLAMLPPVQKVQTQQQLKQMVASIENDLTGIIDFIQSIGLDLEDHYSGARNLIEQAKRL